MQVLRDSSLQCPEKSGGKATGFIESLLLPVQAANRFETRNFVSRVVHYCWILQRQCAPLQPRSRVQVRCEHRPGCRAAPAAAVPERWPPVPGTALRRGRQALPVSASPCAPFSTPLPTCQTPSGRVRARERVQQSPRRRPQDGVSSLPGRTVWMEPRAGALLYSPAAGSSSSRSGDSGAMGSGVRGAGPGSSAVLGSGACRCEPQPRRAGYKRLLSAPSRVPRSRSPSPSCAVHLARREELPLEEPARAGSCHSGSGARCRHRGDTPQVCDGGRLSARPHLPALAAVFSFWIAAVPRWFNLDLKRKAGNVL